MLGDDLRSWFELFDGIVIYRPQPSGGHAANGWINWSDIENSFKSQGLRFAGEPYDPNNQAQRNKLLDAIVTYAGIFVTCKLLERRRQLSPPSLDYRLTPLGRRVGNWGYGAKPGFKKRSLFFALALGFRAYKFRKVITFGALGWAVLNAGRFYATAASWIEGLPFAAWSAAVVAALVGIWMVIKSKIGGNG
jgi:hypothetical protein